MKNLYNPDGSVSLQAEFLISSKPSNIPIKEWKKRLKEFKDQLSPENLKEFNKLKKKHHNKKWEAKNHKNIIESHKKWRANNSEKMKEYNTKYCVNNPEKIKRRSKSYYDENREKIIKSTKKWQAENVEKNTETKKKWLAKNPNYKKKYIKNQYNNDPFFRFIHNLRGQVARTFKQISKGNKPTNTEKLIGCTYEEVIIQFESLFVEGMTWENYGKWHIDHIRPLASFSEKDIMEANHYTNLQPLWAKDNFSKGKNWLI